MVPPAGPWATSSSSFLLLFPPMPVQAGTSTLRVRFASLQHDSLPPLLLAAQLMKEFGEVARLDATHLESSGMLTVTFFDTRSADLALQYFGMGMAQKLPAVSATDFHAVKVDPSAMVGEMQLTGLGELAGASVEGAELVLVFFDMRAAQRAILSLPGCRPVAPPTIVSPFEELVPPPAPLEGFAANPMASALAAQVAMAMAYSTQQAGQEAFLQGVAPGLQSELAAEPLLPPATPSASSSELAADASSGVSTTSSEKPKPVALKTPVNRKDFPDFEVVPSRITSGQDDRTTVMFRGLPKGCTHEVLEALLQKCNLQRRYSFLYMPFDRRRSGTSAGFAFVNLLRPDDVLALTREFQALSGTPPPPIFAGTMWPPEVTYARLQGHEELAKHFGGSAVMHDPDLSRRPQFRNLGQLSTGTVASAATKKSPGAPVTAARDEKPHLAEAEPSSHCGGSRTPVELEDFNDSKVEVCLSRSVGCA